MHNSDLNQQPVSQNYPSNQPPNPLQALKSRLSNKNATTTLSHNNQSSAPQISLDDLPKTPLTDAQKIQKINEILAEFQREMNKLRLKRNQAVEDYVQQLAWQKANQILASIKQMFSNITNRFSKK
jgi:hypothetical protein